jgi:hypothetical protein
MSSDDFRKYAKIINEGLGYAMIEPQDESSVSYSSVKNTDKGQIKIEATAEDMTALEDVLKLAGIEKDPQHSNIKDMPDDEPEPVDPHDKDDDDNCDVCDADVDDCECPDHDHPEDDDQPNYSTDKKVILSYLKDQLQNKLY